MIREHCVLLIRRAQEPGRGRWTIPGGMVRVGESLREAVVREVAEETGLTVTAGPVVEVAERIHRNTSGRPVFHYVIVDHLCTGASGDAVAASDAAAVAWVRPEDFGQYDIIDGTARAVEQGFAALTPATEHRPGETAR